MKKLFVSVLAIAGLVACNTEDVVRVQGPEAIRFEGTFVENVTRSEDPSTTTDNIQEFSVWAYMTDETGIVFDDELVSRNGDAWSYTNTQYWLPGNAYRFAAFAGNRNDVKGLPATMATDGLGEITFTNVNGTNDILYAEKFVESAANDQEAVKLQFAHLLSKVKFSFKNGFANDNNYVQVENIKMTVPAEGSVVLSTKNYEARNFKWTTAAEDSNLILDFGDIAEAKKLAIRDGESSDYERLTIPANAERKYVITFEVSVWNGEQEGIDNRKMTVEMSGLELLAGHAYNFVATINQENLDLNAIEFMVEVDKWVEHEFDGGAVQDEVKFVSTAEELQAVLDAADGDLSIVLGGDIFVATDKPVLVSEVAGKTIAINGNGYKFDGCFQINGHSSYPGGITVFENINFETADASKFVGGAFIYGGTNNGDTSKRYPDSVFVKDCTFTATDAAVDAAVGIKFWSLKGDLVVENCQANGMHSLMQLTSCGDANVLVNNVTVENCKNGLSLQYCKANINNSTIKTREYGIRVNGDNPAKLVSINNTTIEAKQPVIARKVTKAGLAVSIDENSQLITDEVYDVVFTKGQDDAAYVAPTVDFAFNGPANLVVFPNNYAAAATTDELKAALENDNVSVVEVTEDLTYGSSVYVSIDKDMTINAEGNTISAGGASSLTPSIAVMGEYDVTLNDANIVGGFVGAYYGAYVEVNGGSLKFTDGKSGRNCFYAAGTDENTSIIVINDVDVNMANAGGNSYLCAHGNAIIYVNGGNFYGKPVGSSNPYVKEVELNGYTGQVIITGGTFNFDPSEWVATGYVATKSGSVWTVE